MSNKYADQLRSLVFADYSVEEVERYIRLSHSQFESKPDIELLSACILAKGNSQIRGKSSTVSIPLHANKGHRAGNLKPTLEELMSDRTNWQDQAADIFINRRSPIQLTRLEEHGAGLNPLQGLIDLIERKSNIQGDESIQLAVLLDHEFEFSKKSLMKALGEMSIPYKRIYVLAQVGDTPLIGKFTIMEVYPKWGETEVALDYGGSDA